MHGRHKDILDEVSERAGQFLGDKQSTSFYRMKNKAESLSRWTHALMKKGKKEGKKLKEIEIVFMLK